MWEISSGKSSYIYNENDHFIATDKYNKWNKTIQCWDADPIKRPGLGDLYNKILK
jgi:hypothetical protein